MNFPKLEILYLNNNNITEINILEKVNFKELQTLDLSYNNISDINVFQKVEFNKLELLNLYNNEINQNKYHSLISNLKSRIKVLL